MSDEFMLYLDDDGVARRYEDTYDITIHCESEEDQEKAIELIKSRQWIPCSERMPTKPGRYLATVEVLGSRSRVETTLFDGDDFWENVRAWMPLPEPYKEDSDD